MIDPVLGDPIGMDDVQTILDALEARKENFPDEPKEIAMMVVLLNVGDRYTPVACVNGEWKGLKKDIPRTDGIPNCPNGHVMTEGQGITLGWVPSQ